MGKQDEFQQDLNQRGEFQTIYRAYLLFKEDIQRPLAVEIKKSLEEQLGNVDLITDGMESLYSFALKDYLVEFKEGKLPAQLMCTTVLPFDKSKIGLFERSQFWDCEESEDILKECKYQVMISDFMSAGLPYKERCNIFTKWVEVAVQNFPGCVAVYFEASRKLLTVEQILDNPYSEKDKFLYGGLNVRFFNIQGNNEMVVDTLGLYAIGLPDIQYHFKNIDVNDMVYHARCIASYIFEHDAPIKSGETIDGMSMHEIDPDIRWTCQYEEALIQPSREVMDVCAGEYAAGSREEH